MAHIETRKLSDGSTAYRVIWTDPAGNRQRRQFSKAVTPRPAEEARKFKIKLEGELLAGTYVDPAAGQVTFREFAETYRGSLHQRRTSEERLEQILRVHVFPLIGHMRLGAIRRREIQGMVNALAVKPVGGLRSGVRPTLAPSYVENIYRITAGVFRAAVLDHLIPATPCVKIRLPKRDASPIVIPTPDQVAVVARTITPRYRALVLTAAGTGLRSGELRGLDLERLRMLERTVVVDRQVHTPDGAPHYFGPPKTNAGYRSVPLTESYAGVVAEHLEEFGTGTDGLVFTSRSGQPIRRKTLAEALGPLLRELGLPPRSGMHVFRHYYVSGLIAAGVDVLTVMRRVGHSSSEETLETYGHLWHDHEERTRDAVEANFPGGSQGVPRGFKGSAGGRRKAQPVTPLTGHVRIERQVGS